MKKGPDYIVQLNDYRLLIIILLITSLIITFFSNIIVIIVMKRSHTEDVMSASKRPNILMTTIAISGLILITNFCFKVFILIPIILNFSEIMCLVIESIVSYIFALSLYVISFTMALISIHQNYSLTRVFNNPLDKVSTKLLLRIIWLASSVLSVFFLLKSNVLYYEWRTHSLVCYNYVNYLNRLNVNKHFRIWYITIRFLLQYVIPALIIFGFSVRTVVYFLRKYFQKKEMCLELVIALRLFLIFVIFIATNSAFHLYTMKSVFKLTYDDQDPCDFFTNNWIQGYLFLLNFTFIPIIYFWFSKGFWKKFYTHIVHRWVDPGIATIRERVIRL